jgi:hypothetical protein
VVKGNELTREPADPAQVLTRRTFLRARSVSKTLFLTLGLTGSPATMGRFREIFRFQFLTGSKRFQVVAFVALLLCASTAVYFSLYISSQTEYFNNRNFRQLSSLSNQVSARVDDLKNGFSNSVKNTLKGEATFADSLKSIVGISFEDVNRTAGKKPAPTKNAPQTLTQSKSDSVSCTIALLQDHGETGLQITCDAAGEQFSAKTRLADLIVPFVDSDLAVGHKRSEHEEGFDDVLIAAAGDSSASLPAGSVIFDQGTSELTATSLNSLKTAHSEQKLDFATFSQTTNFADIELGGDDYKLYVQPLRLNTGTAGSDWIICGLVQAGHFRHQTWAIPYPSLIVLAFLVALVPLSWPFLKILFIGPKDRLRLADVYFVCFSLLMAAALVTLFSLWVFAYSRNETQLDEQLATLSGSIDWNMHAEIRRVLGEIEQLDQLKDAGFPSAPSPRAAGNAADTAGGLPATNGAGPVRPPQLAAPDKGERDKPVTGKSTPERNEAVQETRILERLCPARDPEGAENCVRHLIYPYFNVIIWIDGHGDQTTKWLTNPIKTNPHRVADRSYFSEIVNGHALKIDGQEFWITPQASSITGAKTVVISRPLVDPGQPTAPAEATQDNSLTKKAPANVVVAMATNLSSVMDALMPPGFGYRIINPRGEVQLQSAETQQWKENFFEECNNDLSLRSAVAARSQQRLNINYKGREHSLLVTPLGETPEWSLVVFRDKKPLRTLHLEILTLAGSLFLVYAVILLGVFIVFYLFRTSTNRRNEWIWPWPESLPTYYRSIVMTLLFCAVAITFIAATARKVTVLAVSITAFVGIAGFLLRLKLGWVSKAVNRVAQEMRIERSFDYARAYIANLVLLVALVGVLPAVAFFKVAYDEEMRLFVKHTQYTLAQTLAQRYKRITDQYTTRRSPGNPGPIASNTALATALRDQRVQNFNDVYGKSFFDTTFSQRVAKVDSRPPSEQHEQRDWLQRFFVGRLPFFNHTSVELSGLMQNRSDDNSWWWREGAGNLHLQVPQDVKAGQLQVDVNTPLNELVARPSFRDMSSGLLLLAFGLLFAVLFLLCRFIVTKVFLLDFQERSLPRLPATGFNHLEQNLFVVKSLVANPLPTFAANGELHFIDLKHTRAATLQHIPASIPAGIRTIVLDNFDYGMTLPELGRSSLDLIERAWNNDRRIVIVSGGEPSDLHWSEGRRNGDRAIGLMMDYRWAEIAGRFVKVYSGESCCADDFDQTLQDLESSPEFLRQSRSQKKKFEQSLAVLREECSPRLALRRMGKEIVKPGSFADLGPAGVRRQISDQARLYYQRIWQSCSEGERLTLLHLAEDRLLSPKDPHIEPLFMKGLIFRSPDLRMLNETFKQFVLQDGFTGALASIEDQAKKMSPWENLKWPLVFAAGGVVLFLMFTQREFFGSSGSSLSLITGFTTAIPAVFKLLGFLQSQSTGSKMLNSAANR